MRLLEILKCKFIIPFSVTLLLMLVTILAVSIIYSNSYYNPELETHFSSMEYKKMRPVLSTAQALVFKEMQRNINILSSLRKIYILYHSDNPFTGTDQYDEIKKFIEGFSFNKRDLAMHYTDHTDEFQKKGSWFINTEIDEVNKIIEVIDKIPADPKQDLFLLRLKHLFSFTQMVKSFELFYNMANEGFSQKVDGFYIMNRKSEVLFSYPILADNRDYYEKYLKFEQPTFCMNKEAKNPDYLYFPCNNWFGEYTKFLDKRIEDLSLTNVHDLHKFIYVSTPFKTIYKSSEDYSISICINTIDEYQSVNSPSVDFPQDYDDRIFICMDMPLGSLFKTLDNFNIYGNGYFFIMTQSSTVPFYYPGLGTKDYYGNDITRLEFSTLKEHFISEVTYFNETILKVGIKDYTDNVVTPSVNRGAEFSSIPFENGVKLNIETFSKNEKIYNFIIFPIKFMAFQEGEVHLFNGVLIIDKASLDFSHGEYSSSIYFLTVECAVLFTGFGVIVIMISTQLILVFGKNIINPIKEIQARIQLNEKQSNQTDAKNGDEKNKEGNGKNRLTNLNQNKDCDNGDNSNNSQSPSDENMGLLNETEENEVQKQQREEEDTQLLEEADEGIQIENQEIKKTFELILKLKKVFLFLENSQATFDKDLIGNFVSSKEVFGERCNAIGQEICNSNIGNGSSLCYRYDKAITFLSNSLQISLNSEMNPSPNFNDGIIALLKNHTFQENTKEGKRGASVIQIINSNRDSYAINSDRNNLLKKTKESEIDITEMNAKSDNSVKLWRYLKLFYAYRMFFSHLKKINQNGNHISSIPIEKLVKRSYGYYLDNYINTNTHTFQHCIKVLYDYILKLNEEEGMKKKKEKVLYFLNEFFHFKGDELKLQAKLEANRRIKLEMKNNEESEYEEVKQSDNYPFKSRLFEGLEEIYLGSKFIKECLDEMEKEYKEHQFNYYTFLHELKDIKEESQNIPFNFFLLNQRFKYLQGKLAKLCGDYSLAIEKYLGVIDDHQLIVQGILFTKANEKVISILKYQKIKPEILKIRSSEEAIVGKISNFCNNNIREGTEKHKDIHLIIDTKANDKNPKLPELQIKAAIKIFEIFLSTNDRFALYTNTDNDVKKVFPGNYRNPQTYSFITAIFNDLLEEQQHADKDKQYGFTLDKNKDINDKEKKSNQIINNGKNGMDSVKYVLNEIKGKMEGNRKIIVIGISECFRLDEKDVVEKNRIREYFNEWDYLFYIVKNVYSIVIGQGGNNRSLLDLTQIITQNNGSSLIPNRFGEYENIQEIKKVCKKLGKLPRKYEYQNEKFDK